MKTLKGIILTGLMVFLFFSCEQPVGLGSRLDVEGPVVTITSPAPRKAVQTQFEISGTVSDNTNISRLLITASFNNKPFQKQWEYNAGSWVYSSDRGANKIPLRGAKWEGTGRSVSWRVPIDMLIGGQELPSGEYTFAVQAWDSANFTDDNSFKTIVLILDYDPPSVSISNPYLYRSGGVKEAYEDENSPLYDLHRIDDDDWKDPANIGKFITNEFKLQWQIEDNFDVWSMDLRFYNHDVYIDNNPDTELPDNYIYYYHKNLPPPPVEPEPQNSIKPNGFVMVPPLDSDRGYCEGGAFLETPITEKTTIKVVAVCYDAAGNANEERTLGYFIYWPKAAEPWIVFTDGMKAPDNFYGKTIAEIEEDVFMVYPGRTIKATAYQVNGVSRVEYSLYRCEEEGNVLTSNLILIGEENIRIRNNELSSGNYSTVFPWEFTPPSSSGYYVVKVKAYGASDKESEEYVSLFRVQDITFPDFPVPPSPKATDPLFEYLDNSNNFTLTGEVSDATGVRSLALVWINPESHDYAAMSQLAYFKEQDYGGWLEALALVPGESIEEYISGYHEPFDVNEPNRLWKIPLTEIGKDPNTYRMRYSYSQSISLPNDLNIGIEQELSPLESQIFLLRVENTTGNCTIITYAPQGDTLAPSKFTIDEVKTSNSTDPLIPGTYNVIEKFKEGDTITINGSWAEDSAKYLDINTYFKPNLNITVNGENITDNNPEIQFSKNTDTSGTWTVKATVGAENSQNALKPSGLKDALVIIASVADIGGNIVEAGASWLIESDNVKLLRITSDSEDKFYSEGDTIEIILEFNKPVRLQQPTAIPALNLNAGAGAVADYRVGSGYKNSQSNNSRQYFYYTVGAGHDTGVGNLNVTSLNNPVAFKWTSGDGEEIWLTNNPGYDGTTRPEGTYYAKTLPVNTSDSLGAGKRIQIDTTPPTVKADSVSSSTVRGYYNSGEDIYIDVEFSESVAIPDNITNANLPKLTLQVGNDVKYTSQNSNDIKVAGDKITFVYNIGADDDSEGSAIQVTGISGTITDIAGNVLNADSFTATLDGIYIDTTKPGVPVVRVLSANNINNVLTNTVNSVIITGVSGGAGVDLTNVYNTNLWLAIEGEGTLSTERIEYTITGDEKNPTTAPNTNNTPFALNQKGENIIKARQIDKAGNEGPWSQPIRFNWDPGNILTRISSTSANGIYSSVDGRNTIVITVSFRKEVTLSNAALTLNARRGENAISIPITGTGSIFTAAYTVESGDSISENADLDVVSWSGTAIDAAGINVTQLIDIGTLPSTARLSENKDIKIDTSELTVSGIKFNTGTVANDNSYNTTLEITFNRQVFKGSGNITIEQVEDDFLLPAVMTEAQYNRLRTVPGIDTYYTRGTNGVLSSGAADTTTKYILGYNINPAAVNSEDAALSIFREAFRKAEAISIPVNNQAVTIIGSTVTITLTGANAPQVPGARYTVTVPEDFVRDSFSNSSPSDNSSITLGGVARPFIRVFKTQDSIAITNNNNGNGNENNPRFVATPPLTARARMDTRTPGASIRYTPSVWHSNVNGVNWTLAGPGDTGGGAPRPNNAAANKYTAEITIGETINNNNTAVTQNNVQGQQWWTRAIAYIDEDNDDTMDANEERSQEAEEMAYRTVITYSTIAMSNAEGTLLGNGDQIWIRGGDAIGSSSIPGFPFTWEDNWGNLSGKRAGIRLMTKTGTDTLNNSIWKYVTWDINATAYVDFIMGRDSTADGYTASSADVAWQYGPRRWAYQRGGWTSYKTSYPIFAGKHRWLVPGTPATTNKGVVNFSGTFMERPDLPVNIPNPNIPVANQ